MANEQAQEKTEEPSGKRLEEARSEGQIAKSQEIGSFVSIVTATGVMAMWGPILGKNIVESFLAAFRMIEQHDTGLVGFWLSTYVGPVMLTLFGLMSFIALVGLVAGISQVGIVFSYKSVRPKFEKINPIAGLKRTFSMEMIVQFTKSFAKVIVIFWIVYDHTKERMDRMLALSGYPMFDGAKWAFTHIASLVLKISIFLAVVAVFDYLWQWWSTHKKLMMTKQELKDEMKQSQLPEHVRSKIRQVANQHARQTISKEVPDADVIVTNPTHYAVALKYVRGVDVSPRVVAKGKNQLATYIRKVAEDNNVPIYEYPQLARQLYSQVKVGKVISNELYESVARVLAFVYRLHAQRKANIG